MNPDDIALLGKFGYCVDCESPFEISTEDGDRATGEFASIILEAIKEGWLEEPDPA